MPPSEQPVFDQKTFDKVIFCFSFSFFQKYISTTHNSNLRDYILQSVIDSKTQRSLLEYLNLLQELKSNQLASSESSLNAANLLENLEKLGRLLQRVQTNPNLTSENKARFVQAVCSLQLIVLQLISQKDEVILYKGATTATSAATASRELCEEMLSWLSERTPPYEQRTGTYPTQWLDECAFYNNIYAIMPDIADNDLLQSLKEMLVQNNFLALTEPSDVIRKADCWHNFLRQQAEKVEASAKAVGMTIKLTAARLADTEKAEVDSTANQTPTNSNGLR